MNINSARSGSDFLEAMQFYILVALSFSIPFGSWQEAVLGGVSLPTLGVPLLLFFQFLRSTLSLSLSNSTVLAIAFVLSTAPSYVHGSEDFQTVFLTFLGYAALSFCMDNFSFDFVKLEKVLLAYVHGLIFVTSLVVVALFGGIDMGTFIEKPLLLEIFGRMRVLGTEDNPNAFATFYVVGVPAIIHFFRSSKMLSRKVLYGFYSILFIYILTLTFSRASFLAALIGCSVYYFLRVNSRGRFPAFIGIVMVLGFVAYLFAQDASRLIFQEGGALLLQDKNTSLAIRKDAIGETWDALWVNPIFGIGFGNLAKQFSSYGLNSHNAILGVGISFGFISLTLYLALLARAILPLWRNVRKNKYIEERAPQALVLGALLALLVNGMFHESYISFLFWFVLFLSTKAAGLSIQRNKIPY